MYNLETNLGIFWYLERSWMGFFEKQKYVGSTYIYFFFLKTASKQLFGQIYVKKSKLNM